jgi:RNA polymerase sigma-70 factor (ECF subfamily)
MLDAERNRVIESWIDAHKAILFKVARVCGATHADREDLFQEIALHVGTASRRTGATAPHHLDLPRAGRTSRQPRACRVALNTALAWRRKERRHSQVRIPVPVSSRL